MVEIPEERSTLHVSVSCGTRSWAGVSDEIQLTPSSNRGASLSALRDVPVEILTGCGRIAQVWQILEFLQENEDSTAFRSISTVALNDTTLQNMDFISSDTSLGRIRLRVTDEGGVSAVEFRDKWQGPCNVPTSLDGNISSAHLVVAVVDVTESPNAGSFIQNLLRLLKGTHDRMTRLDNEGLQIEKESSALDQAIDIVRPIIASGKDTFYENCATGFRDNLNAYKRELAANKKTP